MSSRQQKTYHTQLKLEPEINPDSKKLAYFGTKFETICDFFPKLANYMYLLSELILGTMNNIFKEK